MDTSTLKQLNGRIQQLANEILQNQYIQGNANEIIDLTDLVNEILSQPGVSAEPAGNIASDLRIVYLKEMVRSFEMNEADIILVARAQGAQTFVLTDLSNEQVESVYKEAKGLYDEGLLSSYLTHLTIQEHTDILQAT